MAAVPPSLLVAVHSKPFDGVTQASTTCKGLWWITGPWWHSSQLAPAACAGHNHLGGSENVWWLGDQCQHLLLDEMFVPWAPLLCIDKSISSSMCTTLNFYLEMCDPAHKECPCWALPPSAVCHQQVLCMCADTCPENQVSADNQPSKCSVHPSWGELHVAYMECITLPAFSMFLNSYKYFLSSFIKWDPHTSSSCDRAVCFYIAAHPALAQQHFTVMLWCRWRIWVWSWQSDSH